jgi:hypothetical protein
MKQPSELSREELESIALQIRDILWQDPVTGQLDPERSWTVETIEWVSGVIEDAGLKPDPAPTAPPPTDEPAVAAMRAALESFIRTVESTGGCIRPAQRTTNLAGEEIVESEGGLPVPAGDQDWVDLGDCYLEACRALGREPMVRDGDEMTDDGDGAIET